MPDAKTIGLTLAERATIKQVMEDKNMTYQALAEPLGMNCKVLSLVLDGKTNAKYTLLERLYGAFGEDPRLKFLRDFLEVAGSKNPSVNTANSWNKVYDTVKLYKDSYPQVRLRAVFDNQTIEGKAATLQGLERLIEEKKIAQ